MKHFKIGNYRIGNGYPFYLFAGLCVIETENIVMDVAEQIVKITTELGIPFCFKASYDKANRSSIHSYRGPGIEEGIRILKKVKDTFDVPILTDVHCVKEVKKIADVADVLQIPAFLSRQTDLIVAAAKTGKVVNVKKGQFLSPYDMKNVIEKIENVGNEKIVLTERGYSFGYNNLVVDMRSLVIMRSMGYPVVYDATHSVMLPGAAGTVSGGNREFIPYLTRGAVAVGVDGVFMEVHSEPEESLSDKATVFPLRELKKFLAALKLIDTVVKKKK